MRPLLFSVVFWVVVAVPVVRYATGAELGWAGPIPQAIALAVLVAVWLVLPWDPGSSRRFVGPVFFGVCIAVTVLGGYGTEGPLLVVALANLVFLFGLRVGAVLSAALLITMLVTAPTLAGATWASSLSQAISLGTMFACMLGLASAVNEARASRQRVRELTVAEERARMARDLHDSTGHHLTVIKVGLENAERFRDRDPERAWAEVRQAKELTVEALTEARRWVRALRPLALDGRLGGAALAELARSFDGTGITVRFVVEGAERPLDPDVELVLYRMLQEGLTNALRHANADSATATLSFEEGRVVFEVRDDGHGAEASPGFGLSTLAERARAVGGTLVAGNSAGGGFSVRAELPA
ncbi:sensor histidine kinase [Allokutzneria sp. A3M-2-11 16]|uniref:sensor histidine kinase n=1 Tax=Allokutzneria sp. A3M-2-11 16 TaxID=2962043 RepID=UPI0020B7428C|nr:sensor histidine kinase [Allokutzneria sp. A3M-2-11 16]MCP3804783.1 sensor histidine kinase [Allokutzneria sp. A3M-2-11 16]